MSADLDSHEVEVFTYPWNHWYGYAVGAIMVLAIIFGILYQREYYIERYGSTAIVLSTTIGVIIIGFFSFQQIRRLQEPYHMTINQKGIRGQQLWGTPVFIRWESVVSVQEIRSPFSQTSFRSIKINSSDGTSLVIGAHIRGFEALQAKIRERTQEGKEPPTSP